MARNGIPSIFRSAEHMNSDGMYQNFRLFRVP
jgi:hypothetical protein